MPRVYKRAPGDGGVVKDAPLPAPGRKRAGVVVDDDEALPADAGDALIDEAPDKGGIVTTACFSSW